MSGIMEAFSNLLQNDEDHFWLMAYMPKEVSEAIFKFSMQIPDKHLFINDDDISSGRETHPHLTVLAKISETNEEKIKKVLKKVKPFTITLDKPSLFEKEDKDVLKIDVKSTGLEKAHKYLKGLIKNNDAFPDYKPHITIAYLKKGKGEEYLKNIIKNAKIKVETLSLESPDNETIRINL